MFADEPLIRFSLRAILVNIAIATLFYCWPKFMLLLSGSVAAMLLALLAFVLTVQMPVSWLLGRGRRKV